MQEDMHYYGTYALARCAGLSVDIATKIACSAQFVDDSSQNDSEQHADGGMLYGIATVHDNLAVIKNQLTDPIEQRKVWVPFHFFPGNEAWSVENNNPPMKERLICRRDSKLAREMVDNNLQKALSCDYGPHLLGITAHVYADTFAHYGFSGISSNLNEVEGESITLNVDNSEILAYIKKKSTGYHRNISQHLRQSRMREGSWWDQARAVLVDINATVVSTFGGEVAQFAANGLGHGGVMTYPDRPYLNWSFKYKESSQPDREHGRNNPESYLDAARKLYALFKSYYERKSFVDFDNVTGFEQFEERVKRIIAIEGNKADRINAWKSAIGNNELFDATAESLDYDPSKWEADKHNFPNFRSSAEASDTDVYRFHQAAVYHRYYTLKDLLPGKGIVVL
ncbi:MAG: DUF6765 family protein [Pseudomonadales bacterium]